MAKKEKQKLTISQAQWKIIRVVAIAYIVVIVVMNLVKGALKDEKTIEQKIGNYEPIGITLKDALYIKTYSITPYADYLKSGDYISAYEMLTDEYRSMVSEEEYKESLAGIDFDTFDMKDIHQKTEGTYVANVIYEQNGEQKETEYLLYASDYNPANIKMSPDKFIYQYKDLGFTEDKVEVNVEECNIYIDSITLKMTVKNKSLMQEMKFSGVTLGYGKDINKEENMEFTLKPGEEKEIAFSVETSYYLPNNVKLKRVLDEETLRTYTFYFEED